ncbi:hypothetical protein Pan181_18710 [Aeoliella mucimassa]|uniref:Uncharacterized protein n=1 Tax=Aeoliella mucimassa TaxID=2527972 RepID=A0A518ALU3_9BACT|nr:hypothetical protein Pan181_18710 [Aeoliella mucimassa]
MMSHWRSGSRLSVAITGQKASSAYLLHYGVCRPNVRSQLLLACYQWWGQIVHLPLMFVCS